MMIAGMAVAEETPGIDMTRIGRTVTDEAEAITTGKGREMMTGMDMGMVDMMVNIEIVMDLVHDMSPQGSAEMMSTERGGPAFVMKWQ
jgi:hypothetical protein